MTEQQYWNQRYLTGGTSGYGSYGEQLAKKLAWLELPDVHSIVEVGCGDFNFGNHLVQNLNASYMGYDISDVIVKKNQLLYPEHTFAVLGENLASGDLLLCIDVLFHILDEHAASSLLERLNGAWTKYLAITAYERDEEFTNHVRIRKFDYKQFGEPLIRETVEEDGDLKFYLYKRKDTV